MTDNVIVLKDWVPGWVRDSYMTQEEVDTFNEECRQSQLKQENIESASDNQTVLVGEAVAKLESLDRDGLEKWLHRIPAQLLVELIEG
ncbi:hypothetical protein [Microcoleus sp. PH2017_30_WIL_O_A]|uniref:hypothetical protein n=1 Tax=Microcoleus sp. PH2017_30_WIL_O_A TaxID=2798840 RepID=UPI001D3FF4D6|nr:hypothetical protein [Microcoleus sp. PH2017_30_WIL_O_A]MCC3587995.1 hypothetical protein [Microcoleus sp. PH2017_30_WIL_O_A]